MTTRPTASLERQFLQLGQQRLAYRVTGEDCGRAPVVLLHGWGASLDAVASVQTCLQADFRVFAFDLPGFGQSDLPAAVWGSPEYAELVRQALEQLEMKQVSLIGHSFGGKISILLAARWADLVKKLVLVNSAGIRHPRSPLVRARVAVYKAARRLDREGSLSESLARRFGSADYRNAGPLRATATRVINEDVRNLLSKISAPTLLIWGDRDDQTPPRDGAIMEREIPDAGLVTLQGAGHFSYADDLPRFCRVVGNFLKS